MGWASTTLNPALIWKCYYQLYRPTTPSDMILYGRGLLPALASPMLSPPLLRSCSVCSASPSAQVLLSLPLCSGLAQPPASAQVLLSLTSAQSAQVLLNLPLCSVCLLYT